MPTISLFYGMIVSIFYYDNKINVKQRKSNHLARQYAEKYLAKEQILQQFVHNLNAL